MSNLLAESAYVHYSKVDRLNFETRVEKFLDLFELVDSDVVFLQEVDSDWEKVLAVNKIFSSYDFIFMSHGKLAIAVKHNFGKLKRNTVFSHSSSGILMVEMIIENSKDRLVLANIHAPWKEAKNHHSIYLLLNKTNLPIVVAGDFNTDKNVNYNYFGELMKEFQDVSSTLEFTARNVHDNSKEKIDFIYVKKIACIQTFAKPNNINLLIPHSAGGEFDPINPNNHFSDHCMIFAELIMN